VSEGTPRGPFRQSLGWFIATPAILWLHIICLVFGLNFRIEFGAFPIEDDD